MSDEKELVYRQRLNALSMSTQTLASASTEAIVDRADEFLNFLLGVAPEKAADSSKPKRTRRTAETSSAEPSYSPPQTGASTATTPATESAKPAAASASAASDDDFLSDPPKAPEKKLELADVRAALVGLQTKVDRTAAMEVLKSAGNGAESLASLKPELFKAVIDEAAKRVKAAVK